MTSDGRIWKFPDDINTDLIIPGRYLDDYDPSHLARHAMEGARPEFASKIRPGDIIVAGRNFGCGSSREQAVIALKHAGVSGIVAKSFARIFYRNAINLGLPVLESQEAYEAFSDGDRANIEFEVGRLSSSDGTKNAALAAIPPNAKKILDSGGLVPYLRRRVSK